MFYYCQYDTNPANLVDDNVVKDRNSLCFLSLVWLNFDKFSERCKKMFYYRQYDSDLEILVDNDIFKELNIANDSNASNLVF